MIKGKNLRRGFTLVELLVVVAIIGILAGLVTVNLSTARAKARDDKRRSDLQIVATGLEVYRSQNKRYPVWTNGFGQAGGWDYLKSVLVPNFLSYLPTDPKNRGTTYGANQNYLYATNRSSLTSPSGSVSRVEGGMFVLDAALERRDQRMTIETSIIPTDNGNLMFFQTGYYPDMSDNQIVHYRVASS